MQVGDYVVRTLIDARFGLDGGSMFGVVPKVLWERANAPDDANRIELVSRLLLIEGDGRRVLVDTGLGDRWDRKRAGMFRIERDGGGILAKLRDLDIQPTDITDVVLTHLHFDHAAGTTRENEEGELALTFPEARHHLQVRHWEWARQPSIKDAGSFRAEDFELLSTSDRLVLHDGETEVCPGIHVHPLDGHTTAMQAVRVSGAFTTLLFVADLIPTTTHLRLPYIMSYDNQPLVTLAEKQRWLAQCVEAGWVVVFQHDPEVAAARLVERDGRVEIEERLEI